MRHIKETKCEKNNFSSFFVPHAQTERSTVVALWERGIVFSVCSMFLRIVVQAIFVYFLIFYCFLPFPPKKAADSAAGIKQCKRSCLPHHWLLQTVRGCKCLHIYLGREKTATAPCLSRRRLKKKQPFFCQRMGRKWVDPPALEVLFLPGNSIMPRDVQWHLQIIKTVSLGAGSDRFPSTPVMSGRRRAAVIVSFSPEVKASACH